MSGKALLCAANSQSTQFTPVERSSTSQNIQCLFFPQSYIWLVKSDQFFILFYKLNWDALALFISYSSFMQMLLYNAVLRCSLWLNHLFECAVMTKCLLQSGRTHTHPPTHTPYSKPPKWPICEHVWPATVDQCKFVRQWSMQESPVRAEATRYPHPLHGVCVCECVCAGGRM